MNKKSMQQSIAKSFIKQGARLQGATHSIIAIALASASMLPVIPG